MIRPFCLILIFAAAAVAQPAKLIWADEFNTPGAPDPARWAYQTGGGGWGNQELQFYTEARAENARIEDGRLIITARRELWQGRDYTSARLVTKGRRHFRYGWFEIRAKLPCGRGTWPAIWMLGEGWPEKPWPGVGEIDIMEHVGHDAGRVHAALHTTAYNGARNTHKSGIVSAPGACEQFNVYALHWTPEFLEFYFNNQAFFRYANDRSGEDAWPFDRPFYLLLNVAVGGGWGGRQGVDEAAFPQRMEVDYVRIYDRKPE